MIQVAQGLRTVLGLTQGLRTTLGLTQAGQSSAFIIIATSRPPHVLLISESE